VERSANGVLSPGRLTIKFDWITALLVILLIATLLAFFAGVFPYPVGWIVLTALLVFRLTANRGKE
jgi:dihydroxy-acid dehydratase